MTLPSWTFFLSLCLPSVDDSAHPRRHGQISRYNWYAFHRKVFTSSHWRDWRWAHIVRPVAIILAICEEGIINSQKLRLLPVLLFVLLFNFRWWLDVNWQLFSPHHLVLLKLLLLHFTASLLGSHLLKWNLFLCFLVIISKLCFPFIWFIFHYQYC